MKPGDMVYTIEGRTVGQIHCWVGNGASVILSQRHYIDHPAFGRLMVDHVIVTDEMFASGQFVAHPPTAKESETELEMLRRLV